MLRPSIYSNPFPIGKRFTRDQALAAYRDYLRKRPDILELARKNLTGKRLGCVCEPHERCHVDILIQLMEAR